MEALQGGEGHRGRGKAEGVPSERGEALWEMTGPHGERGTRILELDNRKVRGCTLCLSYPPPSSLEPRPLKHRVQAKLSAWPPGSPSQPLALDQARA